VWILHILWETRWEVNIQPFACHRPCTAFWQEKEKKKSALMEPRSASSVPRFARLSGVWDLSCSVSSVFTHILVLSQSRLCLRGLVVCVFELAARVFEHRAAINLSEPSVALD
jgi:hypothetical protein